MTKSECTVALMQPYFLPALPYLQMVHAADRFIFYDDAQFSHGRWTHRNRVLVGGKPWLFTIPLAERSPSKALCEIAVHPSGYERWRGKFLKTIGQAYSSAPFSHSILPELEALLDSSPTSLSALAERSVEWLARKFGLVTEWSRSSRIAFDRTASAQDKVIEIAKQAEAIAYINMPGGRALYDAGSFADVGIDLGFMQNDLRGPDGIDLSALHLAMHYQPEQLAEFAAAYTIDRNVQ